MGVGSFAGGGVDASEDKSEESGVARLRLSSSSTIFSEYRILRVELRLGLDTAIVSPIGDGAGAGEGAGAGAGAGLCSGFRTVSFNFGFLGGGSSVGVGGGGGPIISVPAGGT